MSFKKKMKVLMIFSAVIIANMSYAALYTTPKCDKGSLGIPCQKEGWEFSGDALYFTSNAVNSFVETITSSGSTISIEKHETEYGWGFRLGTGYHFSTANAILLDWYHYRQTTPEINDNSGRHFDPNEDLSVLTKFDVINLSLGQKLNIGELLKLHVMEGLQFARLVNDWRQQATSPETTFRSASSDLVGPRVALDAEYDLMNPVSIFAMVGYGVLYYQTTGIDTANSPIVTSFSRLKRSGVNYETDTSIGLKYKHDDAYRSWEARVSWDMLVYGIGYDWSGLRFGMKYVA